MESNSHSSAQCVLDFRFIKALHKFAKFGFKRQHGISLTLLRTRQLRLPFQRYIRITI